LSILLHNLLYSLQILVINLNLKMIILSSRNAGLEQVLEPI
jgi:hypothetical protein